jgi:hypothetical protein
MRPCGRVFVQRVLLQSPHDGVRFRSGMITACGFDFSL